MLMNKMWDIFKATGSVNAYLYYRDCTVLFKKKENDIKIVTNDEKRA